MNPDFWLSSGLGARLEHRPDDAGHRLGKGDRRPDGEQCMTTSTRRSASALFDEVQKIFAEHLPVLYFVAPRLYMGVSTRVGDLTPSILRPQLLWNAEQHDGDRPAAVDRRMGRYLLTASRLRAVLLVFVVSSAALLLTRLAPGDFADHPGHRARPPSNASALRAEPRARPPARRRSTSSWLGGAVRFDFGQSLLYSRPVGALVGERALNTAVLATSALLLGDARSAFRSASTPAPTHGPGRDRSSARSRSSASRCRRWSARWCSSSSRRGPDGFRSAA